MDRLIGDGSASRFSAYVEGLVEVIGHADRASPLRDYCLGLLLPGERKSVEPMAALTAELSPNLGDGLRDQAAAVWDCEDAGLAATSIPSVNLTP